MHVPDVDGLLASLDSRQWSEWMAFDRIEPPDLWESAACKLLFSLVSAWSTGDDPPRYKDFFPSDKPGGEVEWDEEADVMNAFGFRAP